MHFCCRFLVLGRSRVAQAGAEHRWHRAGHAASLAWQEFGSRRQELSHVLHVPGICPPASLPLSSVRQGKHSSRNSAFVVMGLGQPEGNTLGWGCYCHIVYLREQERESPACPQAAQVGHIKALWCHTAPALSCPSCPYATAEAAQGLWVLPLPPEQDQPPMNNFRA